MWKHTVLLACVALTAQARPPEQRETRTGRIVDTAGKPWVDASVTFVWQPSPYLDSIRDIVRVRTDDEGRFRARLVRGRDYSGYARSCPVGGRCHWAAAFVRPNLPIEWHKQGWAVPEVMRAEFAGLEAWKSRAPFRFFVTTDTEWRQFWAFGAFTRHPTRPATEEIEPAPDGSLTIPPRWGYSVWLSVFDREGIPIAKRLMSLDYASWSRYQPAGALDDVAPGQFAPAFVRQKFTIGTPYRLRLRVLDSHGNPVPGAKVLVEAWPGRLHRIATAGRDGIAAVVLAAVAAGRFTEFEPALVCVRADGHVDTWFGISKFLRQRDGKPSDEPVDVRFGDRATFTIRGRLMLADGKPAADMPLLLFSAQAMEVGHSEPSYPVRVLQTDTEGRFAIADRDREAPYALTAVLLPQHKAVLPNQPRYPLANLAFLAVCRYPSGERLDSSELRLDKLRAIDLQVLSAENLPVHFAQVLVGLGRDRNKLTVPRVFFASSVGRVRLLVPHAAPLTLAVAAVDHGYKALHLDELPEAEQSTSLRLQFDPLVPIAGRFVDEHGNPKRNVVVDLGFDENIVSDLSRLYRFALRRHQMKTDERGRFRFLAVGGRRYRLRALFEHAPDHWQFKNLETIDLGSDPIDDLELVLDSKLAWERKN